MANLKLNEYQNEAMRTAIYPVDRGIEYAVLGLTSEAGEVAGKLKKVIRDSGGQMSATTKADLVDEVGDVLWYIAAVARELDVTLEGVASRNLNKLEDRANRGALKGSGDAR